VALKLLEVKPHQVNLRDQEAKLLVAPKLLEVKPLVNLRNQVAKLLVDPRPQVAPKLQVALKPQVVKLHQVNLRRAKKEVRLLVDPRQQVDPRPQEDLRLLEVKPRLLVNQK